MYDDNLTARNVETESFPYREFVVRVKPPSVVKQGLQTIKNKLERFKVPTSTTDSMPHSPLFCAPSLSCLHASSSIVQALHKE